MSSFYIHQPAGIYVHVPFCRRKCVYCDFFSITDQGLVDAYIAALGREAAMTLPEKALPFDSLYLGGGTPSTLNQKQIIEIMNIINKHKDICTFSEITIEVNPESARQDWLQAVRQAGANRVSIGVQSFNDGALDFLGRLHTVDQARQAFAAARAGGFDNIGVDLIYGLPGQTRAELLTDLNQAVSLEPDHVSCYMLTVEPDTPLAVSLHKKDFQPLAEAALGDMFLTVSEVLTHHGYLHYEISNFARRPQDLSQHNTKYWRRISYVGLGPSAHSCSGRERYWNVKSVPGFVDRLAAGRSPCLSEETLSVHQQMTEALYLGLRLAAGINLDDFNREFAVDFQALFRPVLSRYQDDRLLEITGRQCFLSIRGMLFHETIVADLADLLPE